MEEHVQINDNKKLLVVTVGLPRSGKSTWSREQNLPIVNPDGIRLALHGERYLPQAEPWVWTFAKTMVEALFNAGHDIVILDATNVTQKERDQWIDEKWDVVFHWVATTKEECISRAMKTNDLEIVEVINRMNKDFEPLTSDTGESP